MADSQISIIEAVTPILSVRDVNASIEYYETVLGFRLAWKWGESVRLASVCRDRIEVNLAAGDPEQAQSPGKVYFNVSGIDALFDEFTKAGARITIPLADRPYGMRDFRVLDPDENELSFGEAMNREASN